MIEQQSIKQNFLQFLNKTKPASGLAVSINNIASYIPKITHSMTNSELYQHFGLTEDEIKLIEETIK